MISASRAEPRHWAQPAIRRRRENDNGRGAGGSRAIVAARRPGAVFADAEMTVGWLAALLIPADADAEAQASRHQREQQADFALLQWEGALICGDQRGGSLQRARAVHHHIGQRDSQIGA